MFILISILASIIAGMGIGGGTIYIILMTVFNVFTQKEAMAYNLVMFVVCGITATITNVKNKNFDKKLFFKVIALCLIGSIVGSFFAGKVEEASLKVYFYIFMLLIGIYEIISSLLALKKGKI